MFWKSSCLYYIFKPMCKFVRSYIKVFIEIFSYCFIELVI